MFYKSTSFVSFILPDGMRQIVMSQIDPKMTFPSAPLINFTLPEVNFGPIEGGADAKVNSIGAVGTFGSGLIASLDIVTIYKGKDKGGTFAYFTYGSGIGSEVGAGLTEVAVNFYEESGAELSKQTFTGASKIYGGGLGYVSFTRTTGYYESEILCLNPFGDCGYTPTYGTISTGGGTGATFGAGIYNTQSILIGAIIESEND